MVKLLIIADDFTGALDTGIQFKKQGICTQVFTKKQISDDEIKPDTQVLVIDSETRPLSKDEAYSEVKSIAEWALSAGIEIIFKKTDSALRGNIGAELSALADAAKNGTVFFLPGYCKARSVYQHALQPLHNDHTAPSVMPLQSLV